MNTLMKMFKILMVGIFNLGYLPGGNHECVTQYETTLKTIEKALEHLVKGGCLHVVVYIGHDQGKESTNLDAYFRSLVINYIM